MITDSREKSKCKTFAKGTHIEHVLDHILTTLECNDEDADEEIRGSMLTKKYTIIIQPLLPKNDT